MAKCLLSYEVFFANGSHNVGNFHGNNDVIEGNSKGGSRHDAQYYDERLFFFIRHF